MNSLMSELLQAKPLIIQNLLAKVVKFKPATKSDFNPLQVSTESLSVFNTQFYKQIKSFGKKIILFNILGLSLCTLKTRFIWNYKQTIVPSFKYWALLGAGFASMMMYHNNKIHSKLQSDIDDLIINTLIISADKNHNDTKSILSKKKLFLNNKLRIKLPKELD